jgi:hypothetical protein
MPSSDSAAVVLAEPPSKLAPSINLMALGMCRVDTLPFCTKLEAIWHSDQGDCHIQLDRRMYWMVFL